jgi:threonine aldolase
MYHPTMPIDLRSDTVTLPTPRMREAMARAEVGDDVFGEDPTVNHLEAVAADAMGKQAAVFVPSGTMGNLSALLAHAQRGQEIVLGEESHIFHYEAGGASALGGLVFHPVPTRPDGRMPLAAIEGALRPSAEWLAQPGVICLENTHNRCGGAVIPIEDFAEVAALAERHGLPVHLDGARLFNAAVATGLPVTAWTRHVTSVQFCLSKGLGAPVGSLVAGPADYVLRVRRARKMLGGGMRQAGVLAAAGLVALTEMVDRLAEDHENARVLATGLAALPGLVVDPASLHTNIVIFRVAPGLDGRAFVESARREGVWVIDMGGGRLRAVTHEGITAQDCRDAVAACGRALDTLAAARQ